MISIIVPVYNSEKHLVRCLNSLCSQTYHRLEIILIEDGSSDASRSICERYCKMDHRFRLIITNNVGISAARNVGVLSSQGDYIGFVHPGDWVDEDMFEQLMTMLDRYHSEAIVCRYTEEIRDQLISPPGPEVVRLLSPEDAISLMLVQNRTESFLCNKLFSASLFKSGTMILFDQNLHLYEDLDVCCQLYFKSESILCMPESRYHYMTENHIWKKEFYDNYLSGLTALLKILDRLKEQSTQLLWRIKEMYAHLNLYLIMVGYKYKPKEKSQLRELKYNLYRFKLSELNDVSLKRKIMILRISISIGYSFFGHSILHKYNEVKV
ncbi:glycosyltransferase family 2 protein [Desemzia sp. RIT804]|uniref:glycosyltransferase family 2 protein n=1 Tax=Desemzia sp. RIT 804 TaxID=2810209 RepID=UPI0019506240|nr:glycosyltransferase family 2 protein [Desemzia sp. RIT 804]MBM6615850.1 glycosyltransferase family 2 protein [Desemzia sp. RIT 804]